MDAQDYTDYITRLEVIVNNARNDVREVITEIGSDLSNSDLKESEGFDRSSLIVLGKLIKELHSSLISLQEHVASKHLPNFDPEEFSAKLNMGDIRFFAIHIAKGVLLGEANNQLYWSKENPETKIAVVFDTPQTYGDFISKFDFDVEDISLHQIDLKGNEYVDVDELRKRGFDV